jgi:hypothetical protein
MAELQSGRFKYNDGGWYVGQHCGDGKRHGQGIYTYPNGDVFDGSFIMGKCVSAASLARACAARARPAAGVERSPSGSGCRVHRGQLPEREMPCAPGATDSLARTSGRREGAGSYKYSAGGRYEGEWKNDCMVTSPRSLLCMRILVCLRPLLTWPRPARCWCCCCALGCCLCALAKTARKGQVCVPVRQRVRW